MAHHEISSFNVYTHYEVREGSLYVTAPGSLLDEQRALIIEARDALILYLTTPPEMTGNCRRGHEIEWKCSEYGVWLCACSFILDSQSDRPSALHQKNEMTESSLRTQPPEEKAGSHCERSSTAMLVSSLWECQL